MTSPEAERVLEATRKEVERILLEGFTTEIPGEQEIYDRVRAVAAEAWGCSPKAVEVFYDVAAATIHIRFPIRAENIVLTIKKVD
jgi:hypothetical protein